VRVRPAVLCAVLALVGRAVAAQTPQPTPLPQDLLTLQARANVVQGSGARALGMGGAFLARADDATAASWNPAGLSYLRLPEVSFVYSGGDLNSHETNPRSPAFTDDERHGDAPDFLAATYPVQIRSVSGSMQLSYQRQISFASYRTVDEFFAPAGEDQEGGSRTSTITSRGGFDVIALGSGLQLTRTLRAGATLNRWLHGYEQIYDKPVVGGVSHQEGHFDLRGWNVNLGLIWTPMEELNLGLIYKTGFDGQYFLSRFRRDPFPGSDVDRERSADSASLGLDDAATGVHPRFHFPDAIGIGASLRPRSALTASVDFTRTGWSHGTVTNYFDLGRTGDPQTFPQLPYPTLNSVVPQEDTKQIRAGLEYVLIRGRLKLPLRIGYFNDRQYFRALERFATLGDGSVIAVGRAPRLDAVTAGAGIILGRVLLDVAYVYEHGRYVDLETAQLSLSEPAAAPHTIRVTSNRVIVSAIYRHARR
jgi:long-chain fatty acid transport protein